MAGEIASAFVRIRPDLSSFKGETESGVKNALLTVGKITAGFFAVRGIAQEFKQIADVAARHQASFAVLDNTISNAHASTKVLGLEIEDLLTREARLKGFTEEDLAGSFGKLVTATGNSHKSFTALGAAEDVARARHIDLGTATRALARGLQGSTTSLSRLGIIVPKVTTEQEKLRKEHDRLVASGIKFTGGVKLTYEAQLRAAKAADAQANRLKVLQIVQDKFGGSAATFAKTAEGSFDRFHVAVTQLEVSLGQALLPTLGEAASGLAKWVDELRESDDVQAAATGTVKFLRDLFGDVRDVVKELAPALRPVGEALASLTRFSGFGGLLVGVAAFKAVGPAIDVAKAAQRGYITILEESRAAELAAAAATRANNAALAASGVPAAAASGAPAAAAAIAQPVELETTAVAAANISQGAEAIKELGGAAAEASPPIVAATGEIGDLAVGVDSAESVISRAAASAKGAGAVVSTVSKGTSTAAGVQGFEQLSASADKAGTSIGGVERQANILASTTHHTTGLIGDSFARVSKSAEGVGAATGAVVVEEEALAKSTGAAAVEQDALAKSSATATVASEAHAAALASETAAAKDLTFVANGKVWSGGWDSGPALIPRASDLGKTDDQRRLATQLRLQEIERNTAAAKGQTTAALDAKIVATKAEIVAMDASTKAALANAEAERVLAAANVTATETGVASAVATEASAASRSLSALAAVGTRVGSVMQVVGRSILSFVGGWPTIVAAALGLAAFGIYKLATAESALEKANDRLDDSIKTLRDDLVATGAAAKDYSDAVSSLRSDKLAVAEAHLGLERAKVALATSKAGHATLEYRQLVADLAGAQDTLRVSERRVDDTERDIAKKRGERNEGLKKSEEDRQRIYRDTLATLGEIIAEEGRIGSGRVKTQRDAEAAAASAKRGLAFSPNAEQAAKREADAAKKFGESLLGRAKQAEDPFVKRQLRDLGLFIRELDKLPPDKVIRLAFEGPKISAAAVVADVLVEKLATAQEHGARGAAHFAHEVDELGKTLAKSDPALANSARLVADLARILGRRLRPQTVEFILKSNVQTGVRRMVAELDQAGVSLKTFRAELRREAGALEESNPTLARRLAILAQFSSVVGRLPTRHETEVVFKAPNTLGAATALQGELSQFDAEAKRHGFKSGEAWAQQFLAGLARNPFIAKGLRSELASAATAVAAATNDALAKAAVTQFKTQLATANEAVKAAKDGVDAARETLQDARQRVVDAQRGVAEAIRSGNEEIANSLAQAGSNLNSIGQSLSDAIGKFIDAQAAKGEDAKADPNSPLARRLRHLQELIAAGQATPELVREAEKVEHALNEQANKETSSTEKRKERVRRRLDDLTTEFNSGKISLAKFNREVAKLLKSEGISYKAAGKALGFAFAEGFKAELAALRAQVAAISKFGKRPGAAQFGINVERPTEVRDRVQEQIRDQQKTQAQAQRDLLKDIKVLHAKESTLAKAEGKADRIHDALRTANKTQEKIKDNTAATAAAIARYLRQEKQREKDRPKPPDYGPIIRAIALALKIAPPPKSPSSPSGAKGPVGAAGGGMVRGGTPGTDSVAALLSPGEAVLTWHGQALVDQMAGPGAMNQVLAEQRPHFRCGGTVEGGPKRYRAGGSEISTGLGEPEHWGWPGKYLQGPRKLLRHGYRLVDHSDKYPDSRRAIVRGGGGPVATWCKYGWSEKEGKIIRNRGDYEIRGDDSESCRNFAVKFQDGGRVPEIQAGLGTSRHWGWPNKDLLGKKRMLAHGYRLRSSAPDFCAGAQRYTPPWSFDCAKHLQKFQDGGRASEISTGLGQPWHWGYRDDQLTGPRKRLHHGYRLVGNPNSYPDRLRADSFKYVGDKVPDHCTHGFSRTEPGKKSNSTASDFVLDNRWTYDCRRYAVKFREGGRASEISTGLGVSKHWGWPTRETKGDRRLLAHGWRLQSKAPDFCRTEQRHTPGYGEPYCKGFLQKFQGGGRASEISTGLGTSKHWGWPRRDLLGKKQMLTHGYRLKSSAPDYCAGSQRYTPPWSFDCAKHLQRFQDGGRVSPQRFYQGGDVGAGGQPPRFATGIDPHYSPGPTQRGAIERVPPLGLDAVIARSQRDAQLQEARRQTAILERIARDESIQTDLLRDVELDVRPRHAKERGSNLKLATESAQAAARHNLLG